MALIAIATLLLAGCGGGGDSSSSSSAEAEKGGTLRVADIGEAVTLNPPEAVDAPSIRVMTQINETLFRTNPAGEVEPWLVSDTKQSPDHLTWTFQLRPGVSFSNGQKLTSEDVVFSLEKLRTSEVWTAMFEPITSVKATSPSTVVVKTSRPVANLETELSVYGAGIVPKDYAGMSPADFGQSPVGTGPFELAAWKHGESLTLQRNPGYWRSGEPLLDKVTFSSVPEDNSRVAQLKGQQLDLIATPSWSQIPALEGDQSLHVGIYSLAGSSYVVLNLRKPPFDDPKIREALSLALDREGIVKAAYNGYGEVAGSWFAPSLKYHDDSIEAPAQDLEKAKQLVSEADSKPSLTLLVIAGEAAGVTAAQIIQQNLQEAGFSVKLQPLEEASLIETVAGGKFDASMLGYSSDIVDPSEQTGFYASTEGVFSGAETKQIGELGTAASSSFDEEKTASIYAEVQQLIDDQKGVVMFAYAPIVWAMQSNVAGFNLSPTGIPWFAEVGFSG
ncbi:MAG TPA: ABC transporter substrate-binding protein [Solirubrobacterales bacterium]|nr:ABC transporter substrate-binding protein [Solirubrobacterales bacterium]